MPSTSSDANASASACPQSMPPASSRLARAAAAASSASGATVKSSGTRSSSLFSSRSRSAATAVTTAAALERGIRPSRSRRRLAERRLSRSCAAFIFASHGRDELSRLVLASATPSSTSCFAYSSRTGGCRAIAAPSAAACTPPRPARCGRGAGNRRDRSTTSWQKRRRYADASRDRRERRLGVVGVDVDDRHVEALREVARVARRASVVGIGREADLVVRDHVQRAAGRVAARAPGG